MPYYLAPYRASHQRHRTILDPHGARQQRGWSAIDLHNGHCLLHLPAHDTDQKLLQLAEDRQEAIGPQMRRRLSLRIGTSPVTDTRRFDEVVASLLLARGALRASRGWLRVYLGGLLWAMPVMAGGTTLTESFTATDGVAVTGDLAWTEIGSTAWGITSNRATIGAGPIGDDAIVRCNSALATNDMDVSLTLVTFTHASTGSIYCGPIARIDAATARQYYAFLAERDGGTLNHSLYRVNGASFVRLGSADSTDPANGTSLKITASGSDISGYINGATSVSPVTDATYATTRCGFYGYADNAAHALAVDTWAAEDVAAAASVVPTVNDAVTVNDTDGLKMHMPVNVKMEKLS